MRSGMALVLLLGGAAACSTRAPSGGQTPGTGAIDSTLTFMSAHLAASAAASHADPSHASIVVTSLRGPTDSCATVQMSAGGSVANVFQVAISFDDARTIITPGTYSLGDGWQASFERSDVNCAAADHETAIGGSLEIDSVDTSIHGIADMTFPAGRVSASFDAPLCGTATGITGAGNACASVPFCPAGQGADLNPSPTETCIQF
jgi:hypothetical protein